MTFIFFKERKLKKRIRYAKPITVDELEHIIFKVGKTAVFDGIELQRKLFEQAGFIAISAITDCECFFKDLGDHLLLVSVEFVVNTKQVYIARKSLILNNSRNLNILKNLSNDNYIPTLSTIGDSNETSVGNDFYIKSNTKPCKEVFDSPKYLNVEESNFTCEVFKYQDFKYRIEQIWMNGVIDVQYISNEDNNNLIVTDLSFSEYGTLISYAVENKKGSVKSTNLNSLIDTSHVNIDNYHLFFQRINKETLTVIEMLIE